MSADEKGPYERHAFISDPHAPFQDEAACAVTMAFLRVFRPHHLWFLGDTIDFYALSRFDRDPTRALQLQVEIDEAHALLRRFRQAAPEARATLLRGNHEDRLRRYLWTKAAELSGLRGLDVPSLLGLKTLGIDYVESGQVRAADLVIKHGNLVRSRSGYTATGELDKAGLSGVSGHTHRLAQVYRRNEAGTYTWVEAGCLCDLQPQYLEGAVADWTHGIAYGHLERAGNRFIIHTLPIVNGRVIYDGREITAKRKGVA